MVALLDFDLKLLVALRALLEEANVTRAGERIQMGQSSMSAALGKLRTQFEDELLVRVGRDYELTPFARTLLPQVQRTLAQIERALDSDGPFDPQTSMRTFSMMSSDFAAIEMCSLLRPVIATFPGISFEFRGLPSQPTDSERDLMTHDFVVAVPGIGIDGEVLDLFVDDYVCLVDRNNPALIEGSLTWDAFAALPHVSCDFGKAHLTPADRRIRELGLRRNIRVTTAGFLPIPSIVAGTDLVAIVPRRLASRLGDATGTIGVDPPFGRVEIIEKMWWHPSREGDPAHRWLRQTLFAGIDEIRSGGALHDHHASS